MFAVVAETGELLWKTRLGDRIESSASVSMCGNYIIVGKELITEQVWIQWTKKEYVQYNILKYGVCMSDIYKKRRRQENTKISHCLPFSFW